MGACSVFTSKSLTLLRAGLEVLRKFHSKRVSPKGTVPLELTDF